MRKPLAFMFPGVVDLDVDKPLIGVNPSLEVQTFNIEKSFVTRIFQERWTRASQSSLCQAR